MKAIILSIQNAKQADANWWNRFLIDFYFTIFSNWPFLFEKGSYKLFHFNFFCETHFLSIPGKLYSIQGTVLSKITNYGEYFSIYLYIHIYIYVYIYIYIYMYIYIQT